MTTKKTVRIIESNSATCEEGARTKITKNRDRGTRTRTGRRQEAKSTWKAEQKEKRTRKQYNNNKKQRKNQQSELQSQTKQQKGKNYFARLI